MKTMFLLIIFTFGTIGETQTKTDGVGDFLRNKYGVVVFHVIQPNAEKKCAQRGMRLPTIRELALDAIKYGGMVIPTQDYEAGKIPHGFDKNKFAFIAAKNPDGNVDNFYYSSQHYKAPEGDIGFYWSWSSSFFPNDEQFAFHFDGDLGIVAYDRFGVSRSILAARCATL